MTTQKYYPSRAAAQVVWLNNFWHKLPGYTVALGLTAQEVADRVADARWLVYLLGQWIESVRTHAQSATAALNSAKFGDPSGDPQMPVLTPPDLPPADGALPAVVPRPPGALRRIFDDVQRYKKAAGYSDAIGADLGLEGPEAAPPDLTLIHPNLSLKISGNMIPIDWGWDGYEKYVDQCEIQVDRGTGWTLLTIDTTPGYTDSTPHPVAPTKWKYRAIYRVDDQQIGQWSPEVSVMVGA